MSPEPEKRPTVEVKRPSLRGLLLRGVVALEFIGEQLWHLVELRTGDMHGELEAVEHQCGAAYKHEHFHALPDEVSGVVGQILCMRVVDDNGKHVPVPGLADNVHMYTHKLGRIPWTDEAS